MAKNLLLGNSSHIYIYIYRIFGFRSCKEREHHICVYVIRIFFYNLAWPFSILEKEEGLDSSLPLGQKIQLGRDGMAKGPSQLDPN